MGEEPFLGVDALASPIQTGMMPSLLWAVFDFLPDLLLSIGKRGRSAPYPPIMFYSSSKGFFKYAFNLFD